MIEPGTRLGPYEVVAQLGAGGMGVVYRGVDRRLDREVAIKVLPSDFVEDAQRRGRFAREARTISQLTHPNICTLYDVGEATVGSEVVHYLVMELIDGTTLTKMLESGPLPFRQVLVWGEQIAAALDRAHRKGIVHRDLKPGNVMITRTGAKLLDFGLAREIEREVAGESKDLTLTQDGIVVGTIHYMSPERLEGGRADPGSDIFALGALLYEMAAGEKAFPGDSTLRVLTSIVRGDVKSLQSIDDSIPASFDNLVQRCLAKDPEDRWQSAHDLAAQLRFLAGSGALPVEPARRRAKRFRLLPVAALGLAVLSGAAGGFFVATRGEQVERQALVFQVTAPPGERIDLSGASSGSIALSPDGRELVFGAGGGWRGGGHLWLRDFGEGVPKRLDETAGGTEPFWSPDGGEVAFFQEGKLRAIEMRSGIMSTICDAPRGRAGSWNRDGVILFSPTSTGGIFRVSVEGGAAEPVTTLDEAVGETTHRSACFLPDGDRFLYLAASHRREFEERNAIFMSSLSDPERRTRLFDARSYVALANGRVLYSDGSNLLARDLDADRARVGEAEQIASDVAFEPVFFRAPFTVAGDILAYKAVGTPRENDLVWIDASGVDLEMVGRPVEAWGIALSPDAKRAVLTVPTLSRSSAELQMLDLEGGTRVPLSTGELAAFPVWSPDGAMMAYCEFPGGERHAVRLRSVAGGEARELVVEQSYVFPLDWSPDGRHILFARQNADSTVSVLAVAADGSSAPVHLVDMPDLDGRAVFAADGRYVAYVSDSSGSRQIHLVEFENPSRGRWQITDDNHPRGEALKFGQEVAYWNQAGRLSAVEVEPGPDGPRVVGRRLVLSSLERSQCIAFGSVADGSRALVVRERRDARSSAITIVQNWTARLERGD
jgi:eukaryotic-like serine/threonine-protein kinase